jgi:hypothetical protein
MIDPKKLYRTRDGREVRIYAVDGGGEYPVHGAHYDGGRWSVCAWKKKGRIFDDGECSLDLIEVRPRIQREVWVNVYPYAEGDCYHDTREEADIEASRHRIACVKLVIDCEEGEGL